MKSGNLADLTIELNQESWDEVFNAPDVDRKVVAFTKTLNSILDETTPLYKICDKGKTTRFHDIGYGKISASPPKS